MINRHIAYYPNETPLYEGNVQLHPESDPERLNPQTRVMTDDPSQTLILEPIATHNLGGVPFRQDYVGYFVRQSGVVHCTIDLETTPIGEIDLETIARAILASDWAEGQTVT